MTPRFRQHLDKAPIDPSRPTCFKINLRSTWHDQHSAPDVSPDNAHYYWIPQLKSPIQWPAERESEVSGSFSPIIIWDFLVCNYYNTKMGAGSQWKIWGESNMKDYLVKNQNIIQIISTEVVINSKYFHFFAYLMFYQMMILYRVIIISMSGISFQESFSWESRKVPLIVLTLLCMVRTTCKKSLWARGGGGGGGGWCTMRKWPSAGHTWDIYINKGETETPGTGGTLSRWSAHYHGGRSIFHDEIGAELRAWVSVIGPDVGRLPAPTLDLATQGSFLLPTLQILFGGNLLSNRNRQQT